MMELLLPFHGDALSAPLLLALGAVTGVLSAFFGIGGGWVVTPALNMLGLGTSSAVGTGMAFLAGTGALSALRHRREGHVNAPLGFALGLPMLAGIWGGRTLILHLDRLGNTDTVVRLLYIVMLGGMGLSIVVESLRRRAPAPRPEAEETRTHGPAWPPMIEFPALGCRLSLWTLAAAGVATGFVSGMLGVGGGFMLVPLMIYWMGLPTIVAVATSLVCVALAGAFGMAGYAMAGRVDFAAAGWLLAGALAGIPLGVRAARRVPPAHLRLMYGVMLVLGACSVALRQAGFARAAAAALFLSAGSLAVGILVAGAAARPAAPGAE